MDEVHYPWPVTVVAGDPDLDHTATCPACGFDAVVTFPLYGLTRHGVENLGDWAGCVRCWPTGET